MTALIRGGVEGGNRQGSQRLWVPPGDGELLPIPGTSDHTGVKRLFGGGQKLFWKRAVWKRITRTLSREGEEPQVSGLFLKTMVQGVLLFGLDTWAFIPCMGRSLGRVPGPGGDTDDVAATAA